MAWSLAHAKLHTLLKQRILLPKNSAILMAVSGGQDSLCLARLLLDLQAKWHWTLALVHCDHRWRPDSSDNANHVLQLANAWKIPAWIEVAQIALKGEADAREWRYETLYKIAQAQGYSHVVTGHTASDRAETLLYNLVRGTGIDGISSLPWQRSLNYSPTNHQPHIELVRPLLNFSRQETQDFCSTHQLPIWEDSSNSNLAFRRNRIRHELIPYLSEHFNPQIGRSLSQTAEITAADIAYLQSQATHLYNQVVTPTSQVASSDTPKEPYTKPAWEIDMPTLQLAPLALRRRVMRQLLQTSLAKPPSFQQIEALVLLLQAPNGSRTSTYPGGLIAEVRKPIIWFGALS